MLSQANVEFRIFPVGGKLVGRCSSASMDPDHSFKKQPLFPEPVLNLFMLVSALMGLDTMQAAYRHAIASDYRFYSYGDGSLLLP